VHTSAKARLATSVADTDLVRDPLCGSSSKFNRLFVGALPTFPENFMQIRLEIFVQNR